MTRQLSITVGIPTCNSGRSLVSTIKTIRSSQEKGVRVEVEADRIPLTKAESYELDDLQAIYNWNDGEASQFTKLQRLVSKTKSDLFVFTQDDIHFDTKTLTIIRKAFESDPRLTMASVRVDPLPTDCWVGAGIAAMVRTVGHLAKYWMNGNNYLGASGRCMAFRTSMIKQMRFPQVVNGDAFLYFENIRLNGVYKFLPEAFVSIKVPATVGEQLRPSSRFQNSEYELQPYFDFRLAKYYAIPFLPKTYACAKTLWHDPYGVLSYGYTFAYTRILNLGKEFAAKTIWETEASTKL